MRIAYLVPTNSFSGAENIMLQIAKHMSKKHDVWYCSLDGDIAKNVLEANVPFVPIKNVSRATVKVLQDKLKPDIFHACDNRFSFACALAGVSFISHLHSQAPWLKKIGIRTLVMLYTGLHSKKTICCTDNIVNNFIFSNSVKPKYITIQNVIDIKRCKDLSFTIKHEKQYDIAFLGRLEDIKDPLRFVRIVSNIIEKKPDLRAVIIGDGKMKNDVLSLIEKLGIWKNIDIKGYLYNPFIVLANTKLVISTSKHEGLPLAIIESMSLRKPVLVSHATGLIDVVNNECGIICHTDYDFFEGAMSLLQDDKLYDKMSKAAFKRAEDFGDMEKYMNKIEELYNE